ncbi:hypothetical protein IMZ31_23615 (plasmid) [Pontibacillus sp. ALD_SL1]|uniref:hypothetical protein n=1 Tax=Pontibacillus sp. ALD_SL1 TaxID=2777185 RepID=UPI001A971EA8|nr:hypothetical protein [Pontibacillus sp. ALD_SL1]QST02440.1 hypothetical protein IMZ31_23615 [Pontibacillus sp. ALD_SL1]
MNKEKVLEALQNLKEERHEQVNHEVRFSYNHGYVCGEVSGIVMSIEAVQKQTEKSIFEDLSSSDYEKLFADYLSYREDRHYPVSLDEFFKTLYWL